MTIQKIYATLFDLIPFSRSIDELCSFQFKFILVVFFCCFVSLFKMSLSLEQKMSVSLAHSDYNMKYKCDFMPMGEKCLKIIMVCDLISFQNTLNNLRAKFYSSLHFVSLDNVWIRVYVVFFIHLSTSMSSFCIHIRCIVCLPIECIRLSYKSTFE